MTWAESLLRNLTSSACGMAEGVARGLFVWRIVIRCGWEGRRAVSSVMEDIVGGQPTGRVRVVVVIKARLIISDDLSRFGRRNEVYPARQSKQRIQIVTYSLTELLRTVHVHSFNPLFMVPPNRTTHQQSDYPHYLQNGTRKCLDMAAQFRGVV